ncbi:hypothetical protein BH11MYX3_BH11MYX3_38240 [soil metagenome]
MLKTHLTLAAVALVSACTTSGPGAAAKELRGEATYRDATTNQAWTPNRSASPGQLARVSLVVRGSGEFVIRDLPAQCALDPAGQFQAMFTGDAELGSGSAYVATIVGGSVTTPSGCQVPELTSMLLIDAKVRAEIEATMASCTPYCSASARADAEAECGATSMQCRADAEAMLRAECTATCTTRADRIVAETSLSTALFGDLDFEALHTAALGDLEANLRFDHPVDADGNRI